MRRNNWKKDDFTIMKKDGETEQKSYEIIPRKEYDKSLAIVKFKKLDPEVELPIRGTVGSAGFDIVAFLDEDVVIQPNETVKIPTGFCTSFRRDYVALIYSRSGWATKKGLVVAQGVGVIDSDYRGEWFIPLYNRSNEPQLIRSGDRIAQLIMQPVCKMKAIEVTEVDETPRDIGGFGSTGFSSTGE